MIWLVHTLRALEHLAAGKGSFAVNVGTGAGASVREVISAVEKVTGKTVPHTVVPRRARRSPGTGGQSSQGAILAELEGYARPRTKS